MLNIVFFSMNYFIPRYIYVSYSNFVLKQPHNNLQNIHNLQCISCYCIKYYVSLYVITIVYFYFSFNIPYLHYRIPRA